MRLTKQEARRIREYLKAQFPWLGTDEEAEGADTVETLAECYDSLKKLEKETR